MDDVTLSRSAWRHCRRDGSLVSGLAMVLAIVLFALLGPALLGDPLVSDFSLSGGPAGGPPGPSWQHPLGVDPLYRDLLSRLAHGTRLSLAIALAATTIALASGTLLGVTAALSTKGRLHWLDGALMRLVDVALAFPYLLLITAIGVALNRVSAVAIVLVLGFTSWAGVARIVRGMTLQVLQRDYLDAARALGATPLRLLQRHIMPAIAPTILIIGSQALGQMILAEAVLGYLTVGIEPPTASLGRMLQEAESHLGSRPLLVAAPGMTLVLAVLGFARIGDALREVFDKRIAKRQRAGTFSFWADAALVGSLLLLLAFAGNDTLARPSASPGAAEPLRGGHLKVALSVSLQTLDPAISHDEAARSVNDLIFAHLLTYDHQGALIPELAESYVVGKGGTEIRLQLRRGVRFHDGAAFTALDVVRSLQRSLHPATPCPASSLYRHIEGFEAFRLSPEGGLSGLRVVSPYELVISLDSPDASFLSLLTLDFAAPVCPSSGTQVVVKQPVPPCGAGPFSVARFDQGQRIELTRFGDYFKTGQPYLDGVTWLLDVPAPSQRYRFERGELDILAELSPGDAAMFARDPRWQAHSHRAYRPITSFIFLNSSMKPFDNRHLRRAVALAVDPKVLERVRPLIGEATRVLPPSLPGPTGGPATRHHDLAQALREMRLAGYAYDPATGLGGYPHEIEYLTVPNSFEQAAAEVFQQQLRRIGLRLRLKLVNWATFTTLIGKPATVAMGWRGWGADYPDPAAFFEPLLGSATIGERNSQNTSFFASAAMDELLRQAHTTSLQARRWQLYQAAEDLVREEAPLVPVYHPYSLVVHQPYVLGFQPHQVLGLRLRTLRLAGGAR